MADQDYRDNTINNVDNDYRTDRGVDREIDHSSQGDPAKGGVMGAVGGAVVGAIAGGPVGAVIGAVVGGAASAAGVAAVDHVDHDNSPGENATYDNSRGATTVPYDNADTGTTARFIDNDNTTGYATPDYRSGNAATTAPVDTNYDTTNRAEYGNSGNISNETVIPVVEEDLQVGKREVDRGGARVNTYVEETPVEQNVTLREEHVSIDRRPVDRAVTDADRAAFQEGTIELRETAEEPIIAKQARVVEEVVVGKTATDRTETIRDTVRRTDVEVEDIDSASNRQDQSRY